MMATAIRFFIPPVGFAPSHFIRLLVHPGRIESRSIWDVDPTASTIGIAGVPSVYSVTYSRLSTPMQAAHIAVQSEYLVIIAEGVRLRSVTLASAIERG